MAYDDPIGKQRGDQLVRIITVLSCMGYGLLMLVVAYTIGSRLLD